MYEHRSAPLLPVHRFFRRLGLHLLAAIGVAAVSLLIGMAGYHRFAGLDWMDAFLNAAMLLGGMGPVAELHDDGAKLFAGVYALYSGLVLIAVTSILIAPVLHRVLHSVHLEDAEADEGEEG
jgi:hypothetical protein